jgi:LPS export ABC transporter protein LptC
MRQLRFWLAATLGAMVFVQIIAFSPRRLDDETLEGPIPAEALRPEIEPDSIVLPSIPEDRIPEYTVDGFQTVSIQEGVRQWKIQAEKAFFYKEDGIVHARVVQADIYDEQARITDVRSAEAKYIMESKDLELFKDVVSRFPTGLKTNSQYLRYRTSDRSIEIPVAYPVHGESFDPAAPQTVPTERFEFRSRGMRYDGKQDQIHLLSNVNVRVMRKTPRGTETTTIESDYAKVDRAKGVISFDMLEARPDELRFVRISQPGMTSRSRKAEFEMDSTTKRLKNVRAIDDVKITEKPALIQDESVNIRRRGVTPSSRYATAGIAEFDSARNVIILMDYPQVYQDHDTITGDTIIVHRATNVVEVDQSNAFSRGEAPRKEPKRP